MKRLSNKKRKLIYIRKKNYLRKGGELIYAFKISNSLIKDIEFLSNFISAHRQEILKRVSTKFKIKLLTITHGIQTIEDDFTKDLSTVYFKVKAL